MAGPAQGTIRSLGTNGPCLPHHGEARWLQKGRPQPRGNTEPRTARPEALSGQVILFDEGWVVTWASDPVNCQRRNLGFIKLLSPAWHQG